MKNSNYNLLKLLHLELDNLWRLEKHYLADAEETSCGCPALLKNLRDDLGKHVEALRGELVKHAKEEGLH